MGTPSSLLQKVMFIGLYPSWTSEKEREIWIIESTFEKGFPCKQLGTDHPTIKKLHQEIPQNLYQATPPPYKEEKITQSQIFSSQIKSWIHKALREEDSFLRVEIARAIFQEEMLESVNIGSSDKKEEFLFCTVCYFDQKIINKYTFDEENFLLCSWDILYQQWEQKFSTQYNYIESDFLIKKSAEEFISKLSIGYLSLLPRKLDGHFLFYDEMSKAPYEKKQGKGEFIFTSEPEINNPFAIHILDHLNFHRLSDLKLARKLLEACKAGLVIQRSLTALNTAFVPKTSAPIKGRKFWIEIQGHNHWSLRYSDKVVFQINQNVISLSSPKENIKDHIQNLKNLIPNINVQTFTKILKLFSSQDHGGIIIVSNEATKEARRLTNAAFKVKPFSILSNTGKSANIISSLSSIDGAIILDQEGTCFAFGVILDGYSRENEGDLRRGSRFNSSLRYVNSCREGFNNVPPHKCAAIVRSDDGGIQVIPG